MDDLICANRSSNEGYFGLNTCQMIDSPGHYGSDSVINMAEFYFLSGIHTHNKLSPHHSLFNASGTELDGR